MPPCARVLHCGLNSAGLCYGALHGAWGGFKRCSVKCQVALSVLHRSVESHVSCQSELSISRCLAV